MRNLKTKALGLFLLLGVFILAACGGSKKTVSTTYRVEMGNYLETRVVLTGPEKGELTQIDTQDVFKTNTTKAERDGMLEALKTAYKGYDGVRGITFKVTYDKKQTTTHVIVDFTQLDRGALKKVSKDKNLISTERDRDKVVKALKDTGYKKMDK